MADQAARRYGNRSQQILRAAVHLFSSRGFDATSIRDIASAAGVQPASVYYHFPSKDALLIAVVDEAAHMLAEHVSAAPASDDPWQRLQSACEAHLEVLLHGEGNVRVLATEIPTRRGGDLHRALVRTRDAYEDIFRRLVDDLPVADDVDRRYLRLTLLGAINWTLIWYQPGGDGPATIADRIVSLLRHGADSPVPAAPSPESGTVALAPVGGDVPGREELAR